MMRKNFLNTAATAAVTVAIVLGVFAFTPQNGSKTYEYRQFSTVESVVPGGFGRSRVIATDNQGQFIEKDTDLENFFSLVGINFKNIANNDRLIVDRLNKYTSEGWELYEVTSGVYSPTEKAANNGIFITRYLFRKAK